MTRWTALAMLAALAGCGGHHDAPVGGVSAEEAAALDNAATMLDASPDGLGTPANGQEESAIPRDAASNPDGDAAGNAAGH